MKTRQMIFSLPFTLWEFQTSSHCGLKHLMKRIKPNAIKNVGRYNASIHTNQLKILAYLFPLFIFEPLKPSGFFLNGPVLALHLEPLHKVSSPKYPQIA